ncbi:hypothetical protein ACKAV7_012384 [Fusarium commune]
MLGTYQYPDFPMDTETFGVKPDPIEHKVETAEHQDNGGWILPVRDIKVGDNIKIKARRLVLATGLTSAPFLPNFEGRNTLGSIFHGKDLRSHEDTYGTAKSVTVFGGTKSAWDMVYLYATKGIQVNWVIRGIRPCPAWNAPPYVNTFQEVARELAHIRMLTWFSPCSWVPRMDTEDSQLLPRNIIGRAIVDKFWSILGTRRYHAQQYDSHPETAKLNPGRMPCFVAHEYRDSQL